MEALEGILVLSWAALIVPGWTLRSKVNSN